MLRAPNIKKKLVEDSVTFTYFQKMINNQNNPEIGRENLFLVICEVSCIFFSDFLETEADVDFPG